MDQFITHLTAAQPSLWAYVFSLLPDHGAAQDVLQETNLTLWRKANEFQTGTSFLAWSCQVAYFHVLSHRRRVRRDRLVFDEEVLAYLAERQADRAAELGDRLDGVAGLPGEAAGAVAQAPRAALRSGRLREGAGRGGRAKCRGSLAGALSPPREAARLHGDRPRPREVSHEHST